MYRAEWIEHDALENIVTSDERISAVVRGTLPYLTELWVNEKSQAKYSCSCPQGDEGKFCKHCAALALTLHERPTSLSENLHVNDGETSSMSQIRSYVASLSHEVLVRLVLDAATRDARTARIILLENADGEEETSFDQKSWRSKITRAFGPSSRFIEYRRAGEWANGVLGTIDELRVELRESTARAITELLEYAFVRTESAVQHVDDSDGGITMIAQEIGDAHLEACALARFDGEVLARRLVTFELDFELDTFRGGAERYAVILGANGLEEYRRLLNDAAKNQETLQPDRWSSSAFHLRQARIGLALATSNIDELITLLNSDRLLPHDCLIIVDALVREHRTNEAIEWARRGLSTPDVLEYHCRDLRERLISLLQSNNDIEGVRITRLQGFQREPTPTALRKYLAVCTKEERAHQRRELLTWLEERATQRVSSQSADELTRILLAEGEIDQAYEAARRHGCSPQLRSTLARALEKSQPRQALALHQLDVDDYIAKKNRQGYLQAAKVLERIRTLYLQIPDPSGWHTYIRALSFAHRAKPSLATILRDRGLAP